MPGPGRERAALDEAVQQTGMDRWERFRVWSSTSPFRSDILDDRVAMVTGGGRGIGRAIAKVLAARGAKIAVVYRSDQQSAEETAAALAGQPVVPRVLKHPFAFNLFSHDSAIEDNGYNGEENKVAAETRKILAQPTLGISVTCVRVPILRAHALSINATFQRPINVHDAKDIIAGCPNLTLVDDAANNHYPMPSEASGKDNVLVGRLRSDPSNAHSINLFVCGDQLLKGAALNAVQIAESLTR